MPKTPNDRSGAAFEWPTLAILIVTYLLWGLGTTVGYGAAPVLGILLTGIAVAQFSSLQHEVLHGHPFRSQRLNEALVFPGLCVTIPYGRFRDTHLAHHHDPHLTDPYDDPESNYLDPVHWQRLPVPVQWLLRANNTLIGRMLLGPLIGNLVWLKSEARLILEGHAPVRKSWILHLGGLALLALWLAFAAMPLWAYLMAAYLGQGLLKIRTFLEHRAHDLVRARTVIIEDRGPLALLFLNNNLHAVHHCSPGTPWYRLPGLYAANRAQYLARNEGYVFRSYREVFAAFLFRAKDPVAHPLMQAPATAQVAPAPIAVPDHA